MKKIIAFVLIITSIFCLSSCKDKYPEKIDNYKIEITEEQTNYVAIFMKGGGAMLIELYPDQAPITVEHFKGLVSEHYYDGIIFHRVISDFMIQGGDPDGDGYSNGDKPNIKGEFALNGVNNAISHERGVISMARTGYDYNSASTQFFIVHTTSARNSASLDGQYAAFGKMIAGFKTLDKIASVRTNSSDKPLEKQTISAIRFVNIVSGGN